MSDYLTIKKGVYTVRVVIPPQFRHLFPDKNGRPRANLTRSLGVQVRRDAERLKGPHVTEFLEQIERAKLGELFWRTHDMRHYMVLFTLSVGAKRSDQIEWTDPVLEFASEFTAFCASHGITGRDRAEFRNYVIGQARERDAFKAILEKRGKQWMPGYRDIAPQVPPQSQIVPLEKCAPAPSPSGTNSLRAFLKTYLEARGFDAKRKLEITRAFHFLERITGDIDLRLITPQHVRQVCKLMISYPHGVIPQREADKMEPTEVIAAHVAGRWTRTLNEETAKKNLSFIRFAFEYAANDGLIESNPAVGIKILDKPATAVRREKREFTNKELRVLFSSPLFTACKGDRFIGTPGEFEIRDYRYWLPWVGLYTGARIGELSALTKENLLQDQDAWYFEITTRGDDGEVKSLKTERSTRNVPIHRHLIELGFLDYARAQGGLLFPMYDTAEKTASQYSKMFGRYCDKVKLSDPNTGFHSLRHSWITEARNSGIEDADWKQMSAHRDQGDVGDTYGDKTEETRVVRTERRLKKLQAAMNLIHYEGITPK